MWRKSPNLRTVGACGAAYAGSHLREKLLGNCSMQEPRCPFRNRSTPVDVCLTPSSLRGSFSTFLRTWLKLRASPPIPSTFSQTRLPGLALHFRASVLNPTLGGLPAKQKARQSRNEADENVPGLDSLNQSS
jgi:hypothetical protein